MRRAQPDALGQGCNRAAAALQKATRGRKKAKEIKDFCGTIAATARSLNSLVSRATFGKTDGDIMKNFLGAAAMVAGSLFAFAGAANATPAGEAGRLAPLPQSTDTLRVDFRPFRHCHGPRWDRHCHGGIFLRDRHRRHWRYHRRDDYRGHHRRGYRDRY